MPARLDGITYRDFLRDELPRLIEDLPLAIRQQLWFQQDGAPAHKSRIARVVLDQSFPDRWIGIGGAVEWPARSPDLTPLDFFLWGHLKEYVYRETINNMEQLQGRIDEALATVTPEMIAAAQRNLIRRARLCIRMGGGHFEHLR